VTLSVGPAITTATRLVATKRKHWSYHRWGRFPFYLSFVHSLLSPLIIDMSPFHSNPCYPCMHHCKPLPSSPNRYSYMYKELALPTCSYSVRYHTIFHLQCKNRVIWNHQAFKKNLSWLECIFDSFRNTFSIAMIHPFNYLALPITQLRLYWVNSANTISCEGYSLGAFHFDNRDLVEPSVLTSVSDSETFGQHWPKKEDLHLKF